MGEQGGKHRIYYGNKRAGGGYLDVDMHANDGTIVEEPVENIFWKKPVAGVYSISVKLFKKRGARDGNVPFRALLNRDGEETLSVEGAVGSGNGYVECFRFVVDGDGTIAMQKVGTPLPDAKSVMKSAKRTSMRRAPKAKAKPKAKPLAMKRTSTIAKGRKAKLQVYKGTKLKTTKGLRKEDLKKNKGGKVVSIRKSEQGKNSKWAKATAKARELKGYTGFKAIKRGGSFYNKAREVMASMA